MFFASPHIVLGNQIGAAVSAARDVQAGEQVGDGATCGAQCRAYRPATECPATLAGLPPVGNSPQADTSGRLPQAPGRQLALAGEQAEKSVGNPEGARLGTDCALAVLA